MVNCDSPSGRFLNRAAAGEALARQLVDYAGRPEVIVLGLPRGGVAIADVVARRLGAGLDAMVVRKLGHPQQPEFAIGAIASGGITVMNEDIDLRWISEAELARIIARERAELGRREALYRAGRPPLRLDQRIAILVDDGLATGATMQAAILAAWRLGAAEVVAAIPVGHTASLERLARPPYNARVIAVASIKALQSISQHYLTFGQVSDDEVKAAMTAAQRRDRLQERRLPDQHRHQEKHDLTSH